VVNTHDYQAGAGQQQLSFLQWDWVFLAPMILIISGVWSVVNAHLHSQLASPILLCEVWITTTIHYSIHQHALNFKLNIIKIFVSMHGQSCTYHCGAVDVVSTGHTKDELNLCILL
jgi:hypothetical protein